MGFTELRFYRFRNLLDGVVSIAAEQVFFVGENGQGKTNFLEAIYILSYGGSFRTRRETECISHGAEEMSISGSFSREETEESIDVRIQSGRKRIRVDEQVIADRRELISRFPVILFQHDDMKYVNGPPDQQRFFVDQTLSLYEPLHIDDLRTYQRILKNRNQALKDRNVGVLEIYDAQLAEAGRHVQQNRALALDAFNNVFKELFETISGLTMPLVLQYRPSWGDAGGTDGSEDAVCDLYRARRERELSIGTTLYGPHRDKIAFDFAGRNFVDEASTGQQRLTALILRIAQARLFHERTGRLPILLLDDVLLELDPVRRERAIAALPPSEQRVFTFLPGEPYHAYLSDATLVYSVEDGRFTRP